MGVLYSKRYGVWPLIIAIVVVSIAAFQILRVNRALPRRPDSERVEYTSGSILNGPITIEQGTHLAYRMNFNRRMNLTGRFKTADRKETVNIIVLSAENYELWKNGLEYKRISETGYIPGGKIDLVIEPGPYFLVLDNLRSPEPRRVETLFEVD